MLNIKYLGLGIMLLAASCKVEKAQVARRDTRPNIIVIMSDDHAYQAISAYGSDLIKTPSIDRIAGQGVLMNNAFVTNSICAPSRAVLLTGQYSHLNGVKNNQDGFVGGLEFFPEILQRNGYATAVVGKWHIKSKPQGFDYWNILPGQGDYYNPRFINMGKDTVYKGYVTDVTTDLALEWISEHKQEPFLMMLHQKAPHRNWMPDTKYLELFNDREFEFPETFFDDYDNRKALQRQHISVAEDLAISLDSKVVCDTCKLSPMEKRQLRHYKSALNRMDPEQRKAWEEAYRKEYQEFAGIENKEEKVKWQFQRLMEDYLRCVKSVDDNVGRVLEYLKEHDLDENTIVVYTSDQGFYLGEHGLYDKRFMYKQSFRTPMLISYPEKIRKGRSVDEMVLNLDLPPTLLDFAGIEIPEFMQGVSMKELLTADEVAQWRDKVYYHYYGKNFGLTAHYGIRTERYKLIHFYDPIDTWELYDLQEDPNEMNNLYGKTEYASLTETLKKDLRGLREKYRDTAY